MAKKLAIVGVVLLLLIGGGIFLLASQKQKQSGYVGKPTQWSQAGDYQIKEVNGQTVVSNKKAGFSFKVPAGWSTKDRKGMTSDEYLLSMESRDSQFQKDQNGNDIALRQGCVVSLETEYQKDTVDSILIQIEAIKESLNKVPNKKDNREIIAVGHFTGLKTSFLPPKDSKYYKTFGSSITVEVPPNKIVVMRFIGLIAPGNEINCEKTFDDFTKNITIGI